MTALVRAVNNWLSDISLKWPCASPPSSLLHPMPFLPPSTRPNFLLKSPAPSPQPRKTAILQPYCPCKHRAIPPAEAGKIQSTRGKITSEKAGCFCSPEGHRSASLRAAASPGCAAELRAGAGPPGAHRVNGVIAAIRGKSCGAASPAKSSARPLAHSPLPEPARRGGRAVITQARAAADVGRAAR